MFEYSKLQMGCMLIVLYIACNYLFERRGQKRKQRDRLFDLMFFVSVISIAFDGITAYTVNHMDAVPILLNNVLHMCFFLALDTFIFIVFIYILGITLGIPTKKNQRYLMGLPYLICILVVVIFMPQLDYRSKDITNYSMGISVYSCFAMVAIYMLASVIVFVIGWKNMGHHKRIAIATCIGPSVVVAVYQMLRPEALLSCLVVTIEIIGVYLNMENPLFTKLKAHNKEMVMGFATLVEQRDGSTGGHIKRTSLYVELLARELMNRGLFRDTLTEDNVKKLALAAPMHDIGKVAIPDSILQKPSGLTDEEYAIMKSHAEKGGDIIKETFAKSSDEEYEKMAFEVARYHHEKWDGTGYPDGLFQKEIPLSARIMSVADVFDALSEDRCYKKPLSLEESFQIIEDGSGKQFDPTIVEVFLSIKDKVAEVYNENKA